MWRTGLMVPDAKRTVDSRTPNCYRQKATELQRECPQRWAGTASVVATRWQLQNPPSDASQVTDYICIRQHTHCQAQPSTLA